MRHVLLSVALGAMAACSPAANNGQTLTERAVTLGKPQTTSALQSLRYLEQYTHNEPQMKFGVEKTGVASLALLDIERNGIETWLTDNGLSYALEDGFVRNTRGLQDDLMSTDIRETQDAVLKHRTQTVNRYTTHIGPETQTEKRQFVCQVVSRGDQDLTVNEKIVPTIIMTETCDDGDINFENKYWIRKSNNTVVQSRQWISPLVGPVVMRDGPNR